MALYNRNEIELASGGRIRIIDYQVPLKSARADRGVGKIDLLALMEHGALAIVELKVANNKEDRRVGILEGLAYSAILEANMSVVANEITKRYGYEVRHCRPEIFLVAPPAFWANSGFPPTERLIELAAEIGQRGSLSISLMSLENIVSFDRGLNGSKPMLTGNIRLIPVS